MPAGYAGLFAVATSMTEGKAVLSLFFLVYMLRDLADDASALMSLARNKDSELLQAFEGCFEGDEYKGEIDDDLFLAQVSAVMLYSHRLAQNTFSI